MKSAKYSICLVNDPELLGVTRRTLRRAQEQKAAWLQRIVESLHHPVLHLGVDVNQDVAAGDQVEPREGRILDDAMHGEGAQLANLTPQTKVLALFTNHRSRRSGDTPGTGWR